MCLYQASIYTLGGDHIDDKDLIPKRLYFDKDSLEKLKLLAVRHGGNQSAAIREAVNAHYEGLKDQMEAIKKALEEK